LLAQLCTKLIMRRRRLTRPTTDLFHEGDTLDVNQLNRTGAFARPMHYVLRRLKTYPDRAELYFKDRNRPPQITLIERTALFPGALTSRPWFICSACSRRCGKLYVTSIGAKCNQCSGLQWTSQRQWHTTRLRAKAAQIRARLDTDKTGKPSRSYYMHERTFRRLIAALTAIERAISTGSRLSRVRAHYRYRSRDHAGRYVTTGLRDGLG
jgi:hypothetical protein